MRDDHWFVAPIGQLGTVEAGRQRNPDAPGTVRPYLRVANIHDGEIRLGDVLEMPFKDAEFERFRLSPGDILLNEGQSLDLVGRCAVYQGRPTNCAFQNSLIRFRAGPRVATEFAFQLFRHLLYSGVFAKVATQTTSIAHLGVSRFAAINVRIPPKEEQLRIAGILSSLDDAIGRTEAVIAQVEVVKKALMTQLLTRGMPGRHTEFRTTELGALPASWRIASLQQLVAPSTSISYGVVKPGPPDSEGVRFVRGGDFPDGEVKVASLRTISKALSDQYQRTLLKGGEVLLALVGQPGACAVAPPSLAGTNVARQVAVIRAGADVLPAYLRDFLLSPVGKRLLFAKTIGSVQQVINLTDLKQVLVAVPPIVEQEVIVERSRAFRSRLQAEQSTLEALRQVRAALLDDLLCGRVRMPRSAAA